VSKQPQLQQLIEHFICDDLPEDESAVVERLILNDETAQSFANAAARTVIENGMFFRTNIDDQSEDVIQQQTSVPQIAQTGIYSVSTNNRFRFNILLSVAVLILAFVLGGVVLPQFLGTNVEIAQNPPSSNTTNDSITTFITTEPIAKGADDNGVESLLPKFIADIVLKPDANRSFQKDVPDLISFCDIFIEPEKLSDALAHRQNSKEELITQYYNALSLLLKYRYAKPEDKGKTCQSVRDTLTKIIIAIYEQNEIHDDFEVNQQSQQILLFTLTALAETKKDDKTETKEHTRIRKQLQTYLTAFLLAPPNSPAKKYLSEKVKQTSKTTK
jgi:hypothetical protein